MRTVLTNGEVTEKACKRCGITKPLATGFYKQPHGKYGYRAICITCFAEDVADRNRRNNYELHADEYHALLREQNHVCAICQERCVSGNLLSVDHNHATGKVRGLLCVRCNTLLGMAQDNVDILLRAIDYLENP